MSSNFKVKLRYLQPKWLQCSINIKFNIFIVTNNNKIGKGRRSCTGFCYCIPHMGHKGLGLRFLRNKQSRVGTGECPEINRHIKSLILWSGAAPNRMPYVWIKIGRRAWLVGASLGQSFARSPMIPGFDRELTRFVNDHVNPSELSSLSKRIF